MSSLASRIGRGSGGVLLSALPLLHAALLLLVSTVVPSASADLSAVTTFPGWSYVGLTVDVAVHNLYGGVIVQIWLGANACASPETAQPVVSARVPTGSPSNTTVILNVPSNSAMKGFFSVCAADMNAAANRAVVVSFAAREAALFAAAEENVALALWTYVQVGQLSVAGLLHTPTSHDMNMLPAVFSLQLDSPSGSGAMEQLCVDAVSCTTALSTAAEGEISAADMEYLLSVLRVSLMYINPEVDVHRCPETSSAANASATVPQAMISVRPAAAGTNKWQAFAEIFSFDGIDLPVSSDGSSRSDGGGDAASRNYSLCLGPVEVIAPSPNDNAYQGHSLVGWASLYRSPIDDGVFPTSMVRGQPQAMRSLNRVTGVAALAADADCLTLLTAPTRIADGTALLTAPLCTSNLNASQESVVYYCEGGLAFFASDSLSSSDLAGAVNLQPRGTIRLLSLYNCATQQQENILPITVAAATPIATDDSGGDDDVVRFGVSSGFAKEPFLSSSASCNENKADEAYVAAMAEVARIGYAPSELSSFPPLSSSSSSSSSLLLALSQAKFYVCVTSPDGTLNFTTAEPSITVEGFALSPRFVTAGVRRSMHMQPATSFPNHTYITKDCAAAGLPPLNDDPTLGSQQRSSASSSSSMNPPSASLIVEGGHALGAGEAVEVLVPAASSFPPSSGSGEEGEEALAAVLGVYRVCTAQHVLPTTTLTARYASASIAGDDRNKSLSIRGEAPAAAALSPIAFAYGSVQSFLAVAPPTVRYVTAPVADSVLCAVVTVLGDYYSVVPGVDGTESRYDAYRPYYESDERALYLMAVTQEQLDASAASHSNLCEAGAPSSSSSDSGSVAAGAYSRLTYATAMSTSDGSVAAFACFDTSNLRVAGVGAGLAEVYIVCAGTPGDLQQQASAATTLSPVVVSPGELLTGAASNMSIPQFPNTEFVLIGPGETCGAATPLVSFQTDGVGSAVVVMRNASTGEPLPEGPYPLCFSIAQYLPLSPWQYLTTVHVLAEVTYDLSIRTFVTEVPTLVELGPALRSSYLLPGFYMDTACGEAVVDNSTLSAGWEAVAGQPDTILVSMKLGSPATGSSAPMYLCATDPVNGSLIAFPTAPLSRAVNEDLPKSGVRVIANPMLIANMFVSTCALTNVYFKVSEGTENSTVALVAGPCCVSTSVIVQLGTSTGLGYRTFFVNDTVLASLAPLETFAVCVMEENPLSMTTSFAQRLCYTPGKMTFFVANPSQCLTASFDEEMPVLAVGARSNILGKAVPDAVDREVRGSAAYDWTGLIILASVIGTFCLLLLLFVALCAVCTPKTRRLSEEKQGGVVPRVKLQDWFVETSEQLFRAVVQLSPDEMASRIDLRLDHDGSSRWPGDGGKASTSRRTKQQGGESDLFSSAEKTSVSTELDSVVEVPVPRSSTTASRARPPKAAEEGAKGAYRDGGLVVCADTHPHSDSTHGKRDTRAVLLSNLVQQERLGRHRVLELEEDDLLAMLESERHLWRDTVSREGKHLRELLQDDPFWATRRQILEEVDKYAQRAALDADPRRARPPVFPPEGDELSVAEMDSDEKDGVRERTPERAGQSGWPLPRSTDDSARVLRDPKPPLSLQHLATLSEDSTEPETTKYTGEEGAVDRAGGHPAGRRAPGDGASATPFPLSGDPEEVDLQFSPPSADRERAPELPQQPRPPQRRQGRRRGASGPSMVGRLRRATQGANAEAADNDEALPATSGALRGSDAGSVHEHPSLPALPLRPSPLLPGLGLQVPVPLGAVREFSDAEYSPVSIGGSGRHEGASLHSPSSDAERERDRERLRRANAEGGDALPPSSRGGPPSRELSWSPPSSN